MPKKQITKINKNKKIIIGIIIVLLFIITALSSVYLKNDSPKLSPSLDSVCICECIAFNIETAKTVIELVHFPILENFKCDIRNNLNCKTTDNLDGTLNNCR